MGGSRKGGAGGHAWGWRGVRAPTRRAADSESMATQRKNRRAKSERRGGADRRKEPAPVELERRKGSQRRTGLERRVELETAGDQIHAALGLLTYARGAPATAVPPSCKRVSRSGASSPRSARGSRAGGTPDRVQPVPSREQCRSPRRRLVERGIQQLLIGRENDYERERNGGSEKQ